MRVLLKKKAEFISEFIGDTLNYLTQVIFVIAIMSLAIAIVLIGAIFISTIIKCIWLI